MKTKLLWGARLSQTNNITKSRIKSTMSTGPLLLRPCLRARCFDWDCALGGEFPVVPFTPPQPQPQPEPRKGLPAAPPFLSVRQQRSAPPEQEENPEWLNGATSCPPFSDHQLSAFRASPAPLRLQKEKEKESSQSDHLAAFLAWVQVVTPCWFAIRVEVLLWLSVCSL